MLSRRGHGPTLTLHSVLRNATVSAALSSFLPGPPGGVSTLLRKSTIMTVRGPAVLLSSLDPTAAQDGAAAEPNEDEEEALDGPGAADEPRSAIAQALYTRWILNLRDSREYSPP